MGAPVSLRELEQELDLRHAVLARPFVVGDAPDHVAPEAHRLAHQVLAVREGQDAVLRERDQPEVHDVAHLVAQLQQGAQRRQRRIAHVHVGPDEAGPLGDLPQDRLPGARHDVVTGQRRLALGPGLDPLDERPGDVVARLADRQRGVHVDVRVDEGRGEEAAVGVQLDRVRAARGGQPAGRPDRGDPVTLDEDVDRVRAQAERGMHAGAADDQPHTHRHLVGRRRIHRTA